MNGPLVEAQKTNAINLQESDEKNSYGRCYWSIDYRLFCSPDGSVGVLGKLHKSAICCYATYQISGNGCETTILQEDIARLNDLSLATVSTAGNMLEAAGLVSRTKKYTGESSKFYYKTTLDVLKGKPQWESMSLDNAIIYSGTWARISRTARVFYVVLLAFGSLRAVLGWEQKLMRDPRLQQVIFGSRAAEICLQKGIDWGKLMKELRCDTDFKRHFRKFAVMVAPDLPNINFRGLPTVAKYGNLSEKHARKITLELEQNDLCIVFAPDNDHPYHQFMLPLPRAMWLKYEPKDQHSRISPNPSLGPRKPWVNFQRFDRRNLFGHAGSTDYGAIEELLYS